MDPPNTDCVECRQEGELICYCSNRVFCHSCIGFHLLQDPIQQHNPVVLPKPLRKQLPLSTLRSKLTVELSLLEDFNVLSLQFVNGVVVQLEKQLRSAAAEMCKSIENSYKRAKKSLLDILSECENGVSTSRYLEYLNSKCASEEELVHFKFISKGLDFSDISIKTTILEAFKFSMDLNVEKPPSRVVLNLKKTPRKSFDHTLSPRVPLRYPTVRLSVERECSLEKQKSATELPTVTEQRPFTHSLKQREVSPMLYWFSTDFLLSYNPVTAEHERADLPKQEIGIEGSAWTTTGTGKLIISGGILRIPKNSTWVFDIAKQSFMIGPAMKVPRYNHFLLTSGDYVYAIGGFNRAKLKDCERLHVTGKQWEKVGSLNIARERHSACVCAGRIYVAGGAAVDSIETYNTVSCKFALLRVKLPGPGITLMFPVDCGVYILCPRGVALFSPSANSCSSVCEVHGEEWWVTGNTAVAGNSGFFTKDGSLFALSLESFSVSLLK